MWKKIKYKFFRLNVKIVESNQPNINLIKCSCGEFSKTILPFSLQLHGMDDKRNTVLTFV